MPARAPIKKKRRGTKILPHFQSRPPAPMPERRALILERRAPNPESRAHLSCWESRALMTNRRAHLLCRDRRAPRPEPSPESRMPEGPDVTKRCKLTSKMRAPTLKGPLVFFESRRLSANLNAESAVEVTELIAVMHDVKK